MTESPKTPLTSKRCPDVEPIPDTPENIARAIMKGPPKKEWDFMKADQETDDGEDDQSTG